MTSRAGRAAASALLLLGVAAGCSIWGMEGGPGGAGIEAPARADGLGFLLIDPACDGPCDIEMNYDGGWEYKACRLISALAIAATLGLVLTRR